MSKNSFWLGILFVFLSGCGEPVDLSKPIDVFRDVGQMSNYPVANDRDKVGTYPAFVKSGGGYFYDEVLEYRVWLSPEAGAEIVSGNDDYFYAFSTYEKAAEFSSNHKGAEQPLVLVRQKEWINEPQPGVYEHMTGERITEWKLDWLAEGRRKSDSISRFMSKPRQSKS